MVVDLDAWAERRFAAEGLRWGGLWILSGYRSEQRQAYINPLAPDSLHTRCPALAVDLRLGGVPASTTPLEVWAFLATKWKALGGRWGGDFPTPDPNHFDLLDTQYL